MAGIYSRIVPGAEDRVPIHLIVAAIKAYFVNSLDPTKGATGAQLLQALNQRLQTPLAGQEVTDLSGIASKLDSFSGSLASQMAYLMDVEYTFTAAEFGVIDENKFRNDLEIDII